MINIQTHLHFCPAPDAPELGAGEVHLWRIALHLDSVAKRESLSPDEWIRAEQFHFPRDSDRYVASRVRLRHILSRYLDCEPAEIRFRLGAHGKPELKSPGSLLRFNLSHSEDLMLLAVTHGRDVGVDLEAMRENAPFEIADRYFAPADAWKIRTLPEPEKGRLFYELWTRTESQLKAAGHGFSHDNPEPETGRWSLLSFTPAEGFAAALAVETGPVSLSCWSWPN